MTLPPFVQTRDNQFLATAHIVTLRYLTDTETWLATTADQRTFHLALTIGDRLVNNAAFESDDAEPPQEIAA
jgi:hypothetical protein